MSRLSVQALRSDGSAGGTGGLVSAAAGPAPEPGVRTARPCSSRGHVTGSPALSSESPCAGCVAPSRAFVEAGPRRGGSEVLPSCENRGASGFSRAIPRGSRVCSRRSACSREPRPGRLGSTGRAGVLLDIVLPLGPGPGADPGPPGGWSADQGGDGCEQRSPRDVEAGGPAGVPRGDPRERFAAGDSGPCGCGHRPTRSPTPASPAFSQEQQAGQKRQRVVSSYAQTSSTHPPSIQPP